ncbi:RNA polymerase sigma factor [Gaetbulibacter saemankumensis]|uniref:RNA polymerase sigma factor n=1 Tax=Gaetbulibacter saemankumensis TaxID=311208 RepID=UPI000482254B|nr:RNA polymerase sigma factor [Gaetbulibacter saemankumensis]
MKLTKLNTEQLVKLCSSGNQSAQLEIYNRYYKTMFNASLRIVKDRYAAEDIMQDSFLMAFAKLDNLNDYKTFGPWLKRIVINNSIYHYKKHSKHQVIPLDDVMYKIENNETSSANIEENNIKVKQVIEVMNSLKENYRVCLNLHLIEGYDYEEISEILNISYANCRTIISRAKESIRKKLALVV